MGGRAKPGKGKTKTKRAAVRPGPKDDRARIRALEKRLAETLAELQDTTQALDEARARMTEALEQQAATSEILRVISSSPTDEQPIFDAIVQSARRLCQASFSVVILAEAGQLRLAAVQGVDAAGIAAFHGAYPRPVARDTTTGRAILDRQVVHIEDSWLDPEYTHPLRNAVGLRSILTVPMFRDGLPLGAVSAWRGEVRPFTPGQIALLQTFADQAMIAMENVRLFTELQTSNRELSTALDTQTATSDILRVISRSQTDIQPVFDAIVQSAVRLLGAYSGTLTRVAGDQIELAALTSTDAAGDAALRARFPQSLHSEEPHVQAIRTRAPLNIADAHTDPRISEAAHASARVRGFRSLVTVPMLHHDEAVGTIGVARPGPGEFTGDEIALLKTFADQAVIAIENARLLRELQQQNKALTQAHAQVTEALEQQTATSEILRVISRSQTDVQPVFDTIVRSAVRLCDGLFSTLFQFDGELLHQVAQRNYTPEALQAAQRLFPARPTRALLAGRAILDRAVVHIPDIELDPEYQQQAVARAIGFRSVLGVPMLREGAPIGVIAVSRAESRPFSDSEIDLLKTFADQAVIAVENVRLFTELQTSNRELSAALDTQTATSDILRVISRSQTEVQPVFDAIVQSAVRLLEAHTGLLTHIVGDQITLAALTSSDAAADAAVRASFPRPLDAEGANATAIRDRATLNVADTETDPRASDALRAIARARGYRSLAGVPLLRQDEAIGTLAVTRRAPGGFTDDEIALLKTFADQAVIAIENARLLSELQASNRALESKSRELEVASQHKSEFLASMSHELRTPLNAIIGFSDVLLQGIFGETNEKQTEYLHDILGSGQHLLSLINDILDLSKIEAGRMDLDVAAFDLPTAIDDAMLLMRERAGRRGIALERHVDAHVGEVRADERKVKQVLLNLLSNAVKFTPEGGRIEVGATLANGAAEISVTDTGIGIAPEDHDAVFEEFRQVGAADKKAEGTGLGLALCRRFVELHGGRIWVKSQLGTGSTFTFTLPLVSTR